MLSIETLITFFTASILLGLAPGPDNIFVLTQSALHGRGSGLTVMLGLCTGLIVHTLAVALGVAIIFQTSAIAFTALKFIGAGYLLYLSWRAFRAPAKKYQGETNGIVNYRKLYYRGIIMNITNPKVSI
ncbi:MAG: LysE family translocator, partial [Deltaproteobacteria bacterium]|nr:LysE family translocator [Deltaproteobacteria bacterium]